VSSIHGGYRGCAYVVGARKCSGVVRAVVVSTALALCGCSPDSQEQRLESRTSQSSDSRRASAVPETAPRGAVPEPTTEDSVLKGLDRYGRTFGDDQASVVARMGPPRGVTVRAASNGIDSLFAFEYPGASFLLWRRTADRLERLLSFRVWGQLPGLPAVVSLGTTTRADILTKLGPPDFSDVVADSTILSYPTPDIPTDFLDFYIVRDTLRVLKWAYRVG
jgi:hypothetical protein